MGATTRFALAAVLGVVLVSGEARATGGAGPLCRNDLGDAARINAATAASAPGDEVVLVGTCLVDRTIRLAGERTYRGTSRSGTVIRQAPGANLDAVLASDSYLDNAPWTGGPVTVRSLTVHADREHNPRGGDGLVLRSWQAVVEDVVVREAPRHGVRVTNLSADRTPLTNTQVNGRVVGSHVSGSGRHGVHVEDTGNSVTDWQLLDNWVEDSGGDGIGLVNAAGWLVRGNHVYGVGGAALRAERLYGSSITDNYLEDFTTTGIRVSVQGEAASVISGNRVFQNRGGSGTFLRTEVNYGTGNLVLAGNTVRGNGSGVGLDLQGPGLVVASTGNLVTGVKVPRRTGPRVSVSAGT